jgi:hypothetical protein
MLQLWMLQYTQNDLQNQSNSVISVVSLRLTTSFLLLNSSKPKIFVFQRNSKRKTIPLFILRIKNHFDPWQHVVAARSATLRFPTNRFCVAVGGQGRPTDYATEKKGIMYNLH